MTSGETDTVIDFSHPACKIPLPCASLDFFDMDGEIYPAARKLWDSLQADPKSAAILEAQGAILELDQLQVCAPVPRPGKLICIGLNYRDHAAESGMEIPERPLLFSKFGTCVIGPESSLPIPIGCKELDYEAEFAFVIGRRARQVAIADAEKHVLGYCCLNDVSARDFQFADGQWQRGKSCDGLAPMGPALVTCDEIDNPHELSIQLRLNGKTLQDSNTKQLIFGIAELISEISQTMTLEAGDVISTGTPPGVGFARKPPIYLQAGDVMEVEIEGLGILRNQVSEPGSATGTPIAGVRA